MTISNKTLTHPQSTIPNPLNQIILISMIIKLSIEEHMALSNLVSYAYGDNYRNNLMDTDTFDAMADKVYEGVNNLTVEDF